MWRGLVTGILSARLGIFALRFGGRVVVFVIVCLHGIVHHLVPAPRQPASSAMENLKKKKKKTRRQKQAGFLRSEDNWYLVHTGDAVKRKNKYRCISSRDSWPS